MLMDKPFSIEIIYLIVTIIPVLGLLVMVYFIYKYLFLFFRKKVFHTPG